MSGELLSHYEVNHLNSRHPKTGGPYMLVVEYKKA
jgi:hypothetical protein